MISVRKAAQYSYPCQEKNIFTPFSGTLGATSPKFLYDIQLSFLAYIPSFVKIGLGLGSYVRKTIMRSSSLL